MRFISALLVLGTAMALLLSGCGGGTSASNGGGSGGKITLVAYSTPKEAYEAVIPAFQKTAAGKGVSFEQSYGASGEQSRAVEAGLPASVVAFSLAPDVDRLVKAGLVSSDWNSDAYHGMVTDSVVVFVVRKGNPKGIHTWDDLVKPDIQVITPNPFTSGGARWNIMAAYGAQLKQGRSPAQARAYLGELFHHVPVQDDKASAALQTFGGGKGDVRLDYEQDELLAQEAGENLQIVYPPQPIRIQTPIAATTKSSAAGKAFG